VCVEECDLDSDVNAEWVVVDVGADVEVELELVSVIVTVVTISVFWGMVCDAVVEPLSELVVMGIVGGSRTWPPGTC